MSDVDMYPSYLRATPAAPLAGALLTLLVCVSIVRAPRPHSSLGISIPLVRVPDHPQHNCSDPNRIVYIRLAKDKKIWLDSTGIAQDQLTAVVGFVMANRRDRIVYVDADPQVSYEEFAQFLNKITSAQDNLRIALLTPRLQESIKNASVALCELEWPGH